MYDGVCIVNRWVDGDTFDFGDLVAGLFPHGKLVLQARCRPLGYDSPERGAPGYKEATEFAKSKVPVGTSVTITTAGIDFNGRLLCYVWVPDLGQYLDRVMLGFSLNEQRSTRRQLEDMAERTVFGVEKMVAVQERRR